MKPRSARPDAIARSKPIRRLVHCELLENGNAFSIMRRRGLQLRDGCECHQRCSDMFREPDLLRRTALFSDARQSRDSLTQNVEAKLGEIEDRTQRAARDRNVNATRGFAPRTVAELVPDRARTH